MGYQRKQQEKSREGRYRRGTPERDVIARETTTKEDFQEMQRVAQRVPLRLVYLNNDQKES